MKNTKLFLSLAAAVIYSACGACEDANFYRDGEDILPVASTVEVVIFEEAPQHDTARDRFTDLFTECYKNDNARACQEIIAFTEKKLLINELILLNELHSKQQELNHKQGTIDTQRETIDVLNELNRRRNERINKRREAGERELLNKLNNEN